MRNWEDSASMKLCAIKGMQKAFAKNGTVVKRHVPYLQQFSWKYQNIRGKMVDYENVLAGGRQCFSFTSGTAC